MILRNPLKNSAFLTAFISGLLACCIANAQNKTNFITEPYKAEQVIISQAIQDIFNAGKMKDFEKLESFHLNSVKFSRFDDGKIGKQNYEQNKKGERNGFLALEEFNFKIVDLQVDVFDKVAIATFILDYAIVTQGEKTEDKSQVTLVFVKDGEKWKITHEHFSSFKPRF
jgi:ketosteroid isomerase-like protein